MNDKDYKHALACIEASLDLKDLEALRVQYLGKKGVLTSAMKALGQLAAQDKQTQGKQLNILKKKLEAAFLAHKTHLEEQDMLARLRQEKCDVTLSLAKENILPGRVHPISFVLFEVKQIFKKLGFVIAEGPEIETAYYNFTALNVPKFHPVRAEQDTFYLKREIERELSDHETYLLRTHTSPVQIRSIHKTPPPVRLIAPGRVFRADYDATHTPMFHQIEGLVIESGAHMGHLKGCLEAFLEAFFNKKVPLRFRPSFFPFTEPSAEVDVLCRRDAKGLVIGEGDEWLEILGCGMVHENVLRHMELEPQEHQGFAFGVGVERLAMLKYGISDLRKFFENDHRWLSHHGQLPNAMVG